MAASRFLHFPRIPAQQGNKCDAQKAAMTVREAGKTAWMVVLDEVHWVWPVGAHWVVLCCWSALGRAVLCCWSALGRAVLLERTGPCCAVLLEHTGSCCAVGAHWIVLCCAVGAHWNVLCCWSTLGRAVGEH